MQGCGCKVYPWWCQRTYLTVMRMSPCRDGDAKISWCKCPLVGMPWCECPLVGMSCCKCPFVGMSWCECPIGSMPWCEYSDANTIYSNFPLFSKRGFLSAWNQKYFQILICYFSKSHLLIDLTLLKKLVITVSNLRMGHWLGIWWFGSKDLFSQFDWAKGVAHFQDLFLEKWIFWKSCILRRFIIYLFILIPEYDNLTSVKTHRDRLKNSGEGILERGVQIFGFLKKVKDLIENSEDRKSVV